jgi:hypothetical protein
MTVESPDVGTTPTGRTTSPHAVDPGAAAMTAARPSEESGSPIVRISWCIALELRVCVTVASLNDTVEGSCPLMWLKVAI